MPSQTSTDMFAQAEVKISLDCTRRPGLGKCSAAACPDAAELPSSVPASSCRARSGDTLPSVCSARLGWCDRLTWATPHQQILQSHLPDCEGGISSFCWPFGFLFLPVAYSPSFLLHFIAQGTHKANFDLRGGKTEPSSKQTEHPNHGERRAGPTQASPALHHLPGPSTAELCLFARASVNFTGVIYGSHIIILGDFCTTNVTSQCAAGPFALSVFPSQISVLT